MEDIKFRGKSVISIDKLDEMEIEHENGWVVGNLIVNDGDPFIVGNVVETDAEYIALEFWARVEPETVGQYTGLKDKNDIEIYEGDIIQYETETMRKKVWNCLIERIDATFAVRTSSRSNYDGSYLSVLARDKRFEKIGNLYENPELLEVNYD